MRPRDRASIDAAIAEERPAFEAHRDYLKALEALRDSPERPEDIARLDAARAAVDALKPRMSPAAQEAVQVLQERLPLPWDRPRSKAAVRVLLAELERFARPG